MDSTSTLAAARTDVFGKDPVLGTDGLPLERGVGSIWHRADSISKARFHAAEAFASCDALVASAKALLANAERISAAVKASIEAANAAKGETPAPLGATQGLTEAAIDTRPAAINKPDSTLPPAQPKDTTLDFAGG